MSVPLVWRGRVLSEVIVQVDPDGAAAIESQSLRAELSRLLTDAGVQRLDEAIAGNPFVAQADLQAAGFDVVRSEERRVGKVCVGQGRSRWPPYHLQKKNEHKNN